MSNTGFSSQGSPKPRALHLEALQASSHSRRSRHTHPPLDSHPRTAPYLPLTLNHLTHPACSPFQIIGIKLLLWIASLLLPLDRVTWDDTLVSGLGFIEEHVLQFPLFFMSLMRYVTPTLDDLFMASLRWVDQTYIAKHAHDDPAPSSSSQAPRPVYYARLQQYRPGSDKKTGKTSTAESLTAFLLRSARKAGISLVVFGASYLPLVGRFVLPAASFWTFKRAVGLGPASVIFGTGVLLPRRYLVVFLQSYFASRGLVRELLEPYFARVRFTKEEKRKWFRAREGLLFGFGVGFYVLLRVPLLGVLIYGVAEAVSFFSFRERGVVGG